MSHFITCPLCHGDGTDPSDEDLDCPECGGLGEVEEDETSQGEQSHD